MAVGIASVAQPELAVGTVALVGKMASDATKETINQIVVDSSSDVVKGVAKQVTDKTAELAAQDAADKAKAAALEAAPDGSAAGIEATVDMKSAGNVTTKVTTSDRKDGEEAGKSVTTTVAGDATAIVRKVTPGDEPGIIISEKRVQTAATSTAEINGDSKPIVTAGPSAVVTTNDLTGDKTAAVQQGSVTAVVEKPAEAATTSGKASTEPTAVAVSNVDVKALAKEVAIQMTALEAAKSAQTGEKTLESSTTTKTDSGKSLMDAAAKLEADIKQSAAAKATDGKVKADTVPTAESKATEEPVEKPITVAKAEIQSEDGKSADVVDPIHTAQPKESISEVEAVQQDSIPVPKIEASARDIPGKKTDNEDTDGKTAEIVKESPVVKSEESTPKDEDAPVSTPTNLSNTFETKEPATSVLSKVESKTEMPPVVQALVPEEVKQTDPVPSQEPESIVPEPESENQDSEELVASIKPAEEQSLEEDAQSTDAQMPQSIVSNPQPPSAAPIASETVPTPPSSDAAAHAVTYTAVLDAHAKIAKLHESNELLHQSMLPFLPAQASSTSH